MYLVKSSLCLGILWMFYKLVLEKESMHTFKRGYLMIGIALSLSIPFINGGMDWTSMLSIFSNHDSTTSFTTLVINNGSNLVEETSQFGFYDYLLITYITISFLLFGRFMYHLSNLFYRILVHKKAQIGGKNFVLLKEDVVPHTFFNFIFIHEQAWINGKIPKEIITHESTHAFEMHSLDIILIEFIKCFIWINPFIYIWKKSVQLNHEFLADQAVLPTSETRNYQRLLLEYSQTKPSNYLASSLNFNITKKRFLMMKTRTSYRAMGIKMIGILPLVFGMILLFGKVAEAQTTQPPQTKEMKDHYFQNATIRFLKDDGSVKIKKYSELTEQEIEDLPLPPPPVPMGLEDKTPKPLPPLEKGTLVTITEGKGVFLGGSPMEGTRSKGLSEEMISPPPPPPPAPNYPESPEPEFPAPPAPPAPPKDAKLPPPPPPPPAPRHPEPPRPPKDMAPPAPNFPPPPPPPPAPNVDELIQNANTVYWNGKKISKKKLQKKLDKKDTKSMTINVHDDKLYLYDN